MIQRCQVYDLHVHCAVADYAARAGVPVVRFMPENFGAEDFMVNQERPAAFVFATEADAKRYTSPPLT